MISEAATSVSFNPIDQSKPLDEQSGVYYFLFLMWVLSAIISTCYTFSWDIKMDWGLFSGKYKLRAELLYSKKVGEKILFCAQEN